MGILEAFSSSDMGSAREGDHDEGGQFACMMLTPEPGPEMWQGVDTYLFNEWLEPVRRKCYS